MRRVSLVPEAIACCPVNARTGSRQQLEGSSNRSCGSRLPRSNATAARAWLTLSALIAMSTARRPSLPAGRKQIAGLRASLRLPCEQRRQKPAGAVAPEKVAT